MAGEASTHSGLRAKALEELKAFWHVVETRQEQ